MQSPSSSKHTAILTGSVGGVMSLIIICQTIVIIILLRKIRNLSRYILVDIHEMIIILYSVSSVNEVVETSNNSACGVVTASESHEYDVIRSTARRLHHIPSTTSSTH